MSLRYLKSQGRKSTQQSRVEKLSRSRISRLGTSPDEEVDDLRHSSLSFDRWPYLWLYATSIPIREAGHTTKRTTVVAIATNTEAKRQNQTLYVQALSISVRCMKR